MATNNFVARKRIFLLTTFRTSKERTQRRSISCEEIAAGWLQRPPFGFFDLDETIISKHLFAVGDGVEMRRRSVEALDNLTSIVLALLEDFFSDFGVGLHCS